MRVLWIYAHPEPRSLNGSLRDVGLRALAGAGFETRLSDLYAMKWNPVADRGDFPDRDPNERLEYMAASGEAFLQGTQSPDIKAEQEKLLWADTVVIQFPLWWFSAPAILKGWFDRVLAKDFAYGQADPRRPGLSIRYGEGPFQGKRAMLIVTTSARDTALGPRGVNGSLDELLFPIQHGTLWYIGMTVLPPFVVNSAGAGRVPPERYAKLARDLEARLQAIGSTEPMRYRKQNDGDYDEDLILKPGLEGEARGLAIHIRQKGA